MDFIFMLTHNDRTVSDCTGLLDQVRWCGLRHIGCKEVGASEATLRQLVRAIQAMGGISYLELVGTTIAECEQGALWAIDLGFDRLLGGKEPDRLAELCKGRIAYFPFPGRPEGHPTRLRGTADEIASDCARFAAQGCAGVDLLLYRAVDADAEQILARARAALRGYLIVAGSIASAARITRLGRAGVDAFTVGSAIIDGSLFPEASDLVDRVARVLRHADAIHA